MNKKRYILGIFFCALFCIGRYCQSNEFASSGQVTNSGDIAISPSVSAEALSLAVSMQKDKLFKAEQDLVRLKADGAALRDINKTEADVERCKKILQDLNRLLEQRVVSESLKKASPTTAPTIRR